LHSERCPVCNGRGTIPNPSDVTSPIEVPCHACGGCGYIFVPDESYCPYYWQQYKMESKNE